MRKAVIEVGRYTVREQPNGGWSVAHTLTPDKRISITTIRILRSPLPRDLTQRRRKVPLRTGGHDHQGRTSSRNGWHDPLPVRERRQAGRVALRRLSRLTRPGGLASRQGRNGYWTPWRTM